MDRDDLIRTTLRSPAQQRQGRQEFEQAATHRLIVASTSSRCTFAFGFVWRYLVGNAAALWFGRRGAVRLRAGQDQRRRVGLAERHHLKKRHVAVPEEAV